MRDRIGVVGGDGGGGFRLGRDVVEGGFSEAAGAAAFRRRITGRRRRLAQRPHSQDGDVVGDFRDHAGKRIRTIVVAGRGEGRSPTSSFH